jgi:hypothetical protein
VQQNRQEKSPGYFRCVNHSRASQTQAQHSASLSSLLLLFPHYSFTLPSPIHPPTLSPFSLTTSSVKTWDSLHHHLLLFSPPLHSNLVDPRHHERTNDYRSAVNPRRCVLVNWPTRSTTTFDCYGRRDQVSTNTFSYALDCFHSTALSNTTRTTFLQPYGFAYDDDRDLRGKLSTRSSYQHSLPRENYFYTSVFDTGLFGIGQRWPTLFY